MCEDDASWTDERSGDGCATYAAGTVSHRYCSFDRSSLGMLAQDACRSACGTCGSSTDGSGSTPAQQYCRSGQPEDPWISVGDHPDRIVYGEAGWCGQHWNDDSPNFGGSNVWVNALNRDSDGDAMHVPPFDVAASPGGQSGDSLVRMTFSGRDWFLVRRDAGSLNTGGQTCSGYDPSCWDAVNGDNCWHQATDNLAGTDVYGTNDLDPMGTASYSVAFRETRWTQMLLASGDMSMYVVMDRESIEQCSEGQNDGQWFPHILEGSESDEYEATQYCRAGVPEDPWISVGHHPDKVVYCFRYTVLSSSLHVSNPTPPSPYLGCVRGRVLRSALGR